jgi:hypothetical protein
MERCARRTSHFNHRLIDVAESAAPLIPERVTVPHREEFHALQ